MYVLIYEGNKELLDVYKEVLDMKGMKFWAKDINLELLKDQEQDLQAPKHKYLLSLPINLIWDDLLLG